MNDQQPAIRRFSLADGMVVIVALAVTFARARGMFHILASLRRAHFSLMQSTVSQGTVFFTSLDRIREIGWDSGAAIRRLILLWMIAYVVMRLRRPRPSFRAVALQPGMVAFWAVATLFVVDRLVHNFVPGVLMYRVAGSALSPLTGNPPGGSRFQPTVVVMFELVVACLAIPLAWGVLKVAGRWRPEASWLDRFGRALGVCWWAVSWLTAAFLIYVTAMWETPGFMTHSVLSDWL
jgi:hypothetical protein